MKKRVCKAVLFAALFAMIFTLCGCEGLITTPENLLSPPALGGEMSPIIDALKESVGSEYTLVYPSSGDSRAPIAALDVNGDGKMEAFAFYSTENGEGTEMHINYIGKTDKGWKSFSDMSITAGGVEKIIFCDISGDGEKEILVGWEVYGTAEKKIGIYSVSNGRLYERFMEQYTNFVCCSLINKKENQLVIQYLDTDAASNIVSVYTLSSTGAQLVAGCALDSKVKSAAEPKVSTLSNGKTALFVDEEKGAGSITEVLFYEEGKLVNPLLDKEKGENIMTQRNGNIPLMDVDDDGRIDIPVSVEAPSAGGENEKYYFTNWCSFDGEKLTVKTVTIFNQTDGYYIALNEALVDKTAVSRNIETRTRTFYDYDSKTLTVGKKLFTLTALEPAKLENYAKQHKNAQVIYSDEQTVIMAEIFSTGSKLSMYDVKKMFHIIK